MCYLNHEDIYDFKRLPGFFSPNKSQSFIMYFFFISNMILKYKLIFIIHEYHLLVLYLCLFLYVNLSKTFAFTLSKFLLKRISLTFITVHHSPLS